MRPRNAFWAALAATLALAYESGMRVPVLIDDDCFTDSCVFARCSQELGRVCTDEDVFGPVQPYGDDCRPDETLAPCDVVNLRRS